MSKIFKNVILNSENNLLKNINNLFRKSQKEAIKIARITVNLFFENFFKF